MLSDQTAFAVSDQQAAEPDDEVPYLIIRPSKGWVSLRLKELWAYRELLYFLTWRDVKVRYKQTVIGLAWAIIQPFMTMVVFSLFFGRLANIPSDGVPYPIFSFAALVPWTFFATGLAGASNSMVGNANLIKKIYFPRLIIPLSAVFSGVVDFCVAFVILVILMLGFGIVPTLNIIWLPFFLALAFVTSLGVGLWLSAMNVQFRDIQYVIPFLIQFWMFSTPIAYPSSLIKNELARTLYAINPMVGVIEGFRWALLGTHYNTVHPIIEIIKGNQWVLLGTNTAPGPMMIVSSLVALALLTSGAYYFRRMEKSFADVV